MKIKSLLLIFCTVTHHLLAEPDPKQVGKEFGLSELKQAAKSVYETKREQFLKDSKKPTSFNAKQIREDVIEGKDPSSDAVDFLKSEVVQKNERENQSFDAKERFLKRSEEMLQQNLKKIDSKNLLINPKNIPSDKAEEQSVLRTCRQSGAPLLISTERRLNVYNDSQISAKVQVCLGHEKTSLVPIRGSFEESIATLKEKYESDLSIQSFEIIQMAKLDLCYWITIKWTHKDNVKKCNHSHIEVRKNNPAELKEEWHYDDQKIWDLANHPDCTVIEHTCLDRSSANIQKCWRERISFFYHFPKTKKCIFLDKKQCELISKKCVQESAFGCALYELVFKCFSKNNQVFRSDDTNNLIDQDWETTYAPNDSFAEVATKLAVFAEAKKQLEDSKIKDASKLEVFSGKKMSCSKSIADHLIYDCCFSYAGLAKKMGLAKCSTDELSLAEMKEKGLCHYVGAYEKKKLGIKTSDEHVYCCFPSKLGRIIQEEGRKQLKKGWGEAEHPICKGFSFENLSQIDFSKLDLNELHEEMPNQLPADFDSKMSAFQNKLKEQIKEKSQELKV